MKRKFLWLLTLLLLLGPSLLLAQEGTQATMQSPLAAPGIDLPGIDQTGDTFGYPDLISQAIVLVLLALSPYFVMLFTSFLKMIITLALLRSALGLQQTPPNQILTGVALILSIYVMYPTGLKMYDDAKAIITAPLPKEIFSKESALIALQATNASKEPLRQFMINNTSKKSLHNFLKLSHKTFPASVRDSITETDFIVVIPAFIMSQIRQAFEIGVLIYLPFFVIDLVTANILLAMQMLMLSPLSISLPLKLLLIVMIDGWSVLVKGLVLSFN